MAILPHYKVIVKKIKSVFKPKKIAHYFLWLTAGSLLGILLIISLLCFFYEKTHSGKIYEGVMVDGVNFGGKSPEAIKTYFTNKNKSIQKATITLQSDQTVATVSAQQIDFGYDTNLLTAQAMTVGRASTNVLTNMSLILQTYINTVDFQPVYHYSDQKLTQILNQIKQQTDIQPIDPLFNFANGKVVTFRPGTDGQSMDEDMLKQEIIEALKNSVLFDKPQTIAITIPVKKLPALNASDVATNLGIKEEVAEGSSLFRGSSDDRIYNISLAANKLNGVMIKPGEIFSFDQTVGDISTSSGYRQAYVIDNGKTVLGDGGGVCQVSTTMFRAALNAGLPIVERHQHAYRVGYYEQDDGPGIDAAIYSPTVDFKFKNDTGHALLIQTYLDLSQDKLTFALYGTKDNRQVSISSPVVVSQTPAPPPLYQNDPTLPVGQVKQVDFSAGGADVYFTRTVRQNGKVTSNDTFTSDYKPWQAVYMVGTKT